MNASFFDPRLGERRELKPAAPPLVGLELAGGGARDRLVFESLTRALEFLGLKPGPGTDLRVGGGDPGSARHWLSPAPIEGFAADEASLAERGFAPEHLRYLALKTHYRRALPLNAQSLAAAFAELESLRAAARGLAAVSLEPSARARAGYLHRFREALARDLDLPEALACVWDALRPGALSPGSRAALLRETLPALGLPL